METKYVNKQKWVVDRESSFPYVSVHKSKADDELGSSMTLPSFLVAALFEERGIQAIHMQISGQDSLFFFFLLWLLYGQ